MIRNYNPQSGFTIDINPVTSSLVIKFKTIAYKKSDNFF